WRLRGGWADAAGGRGDGPAVAGRGRASQLFDRAADEGRGTRAPQLRARELGPHLAPGECRFAARALDRAQGPESGEEHEEPVPGLAAGDERQVVGHAGEGLAGQALE